MQDGPSTEERVQLALEAWKTTVGVQEHFNTIEMQIRNLAVTVLTAAIAAAAIVSGRAVNAADQPLLGGGLSAADAIIAGALLAWVAFYFMDRWWYHRLLKAAVKKGEALEKLVADTEFGDVLGLAGGISEASPLKFLKWKIHSEQKIDIFYALVAVVLVLLVWLVF